jgi:hypothetical protein
VSNQPLTNEYQGVSNIQVICNTIPTSAPTLAPSLAPTRLPTNTPSTAPTVPPTVTPSQPPSSAPTLAPSILPSFAPTSAPTYCDDFKPDYNSNDGEDSYITSADYALATIINTTGFNDVFVNITNTEAQYVDVTLSCTNEYCELYCIHSVGCFLSRYICDASFGLICNVECEGIFSCANMIIVANNSETMQLTVVCSGTSACQSTTVYADAIQSLDIFCIDEDSCLGMQVYTPNMPINNLTNTSYAKVTCFDANSCDELYIEADNAQTQLKMYYHSDDIVIDNRVGYLSAKNTVSCFNVIKYFKFGKP